MSKENLLNGMVEAILSMEEEKLEELVKGALNEGVNANDILLLGLTRGLKELGDKFASGELFIPHMMIGAEMVQKAVELIEPHLTTDKLEDQRTRVVIGTVEGDLHDLGKNLVVTMLKASGFEVYDLGRDVPNDVFVEKAIEHKPCILGMSALMTTTMIRQREVKDTLREKGVKDEIKVILGGAPISREWAMEILADAYGEDGVEAVLEAKKLSVN